jgi:hypothetical protein
MLDTNINKIEQRPGIEGCLFENKGEKGVVELIACQTTDVQSCVRKQELFQQVRLRFRWRTRTFRTILDVTVVSAFGISL